MQLETALAAGALAQKIKLRQDAMAVIQRAATEAWLISKLNAVDPATGNEISLILETLDVKTSAQALGFALQIYQAQVDALQAQLDTL